MSVHTHQPLSHLFSTLYDDGSPRGNIGRGSHYAVCRLISHFNANLERNRTGQVHDFAIIWDEDRDKRIIPIIERLCIEQLMSAVYFIGERKGSLTILVDPVIFDDADKRKFFEGMVQGISDSTDDPWPVELGFYSRTDPEVTNAGRMLINDCNEKVTTYLRNIDNLWQLGLKSYHS
ncbi:hypothetical protein [Ferrimonas balearica]|uniref:hypothetical protein n=1 Tax=Ferrimonas balearica TaxID=44012 RepID=UPI001C5BC8AD|nr:hypothetical protein [Ferrimonas balearica]MBW3166317.1 hypothetical protein [Ferrimonas balearica]